MVYTAQEQAANALPYIEESLAETQKVLDLALERYPEEPEIHKFLRSEITRHTEQVEYFKKIAQG